MCPPQARGGGTTNVSAATMTARSDVPDPVIQEPSLARRILGARITSLVAGAAGLVLVGGGASHLLWPPSVVSIREVRPPSVNVTNVAVTANMPDITGLELAAARQAISCLLYTS